MQSLKKFIISKNKWHRIFSSYAFVSLKLSLLRKLFPTKGPIKISFLNISLEFKDYETAKFLFDEIFLHKSYD